MIVRRSLAVVLTLALGITGSIAGVALSAAAVTSSPSALTSDPFGSGSVQLSWDEAPGASAYRVQVSAADDFTAIIATQDTYARDWVPRFPLSDDDGRTLYWRVAAFGSGVVENTLSAYSASESFALGALTVPVPTQDAPGTVDGETPSVVTYPTPVVFAWTPVAGAVSYTLEYSSGATPSASSNFSTQTTTATSFTPASPLARTSPDLTPLVWKWHVRANFYNGTATATPVVPGAYSDTRSFTIRWLEAPQNLAPANEVATSYSDLRFTWDAVDGAATYRIEIGDSKSDDGKSVFLPDVTADVVGTAFVPTDVFADDFYYWQVIPRDVNGVAGTASPVYEFSKSWGAQVEPSTTASTVGTYPQPEAGSSDSDEPTDKTLDDFELSWSPLGRATYYNVEVTPLNGSPVLTCRTASTSVTIVSNVETPANSLSGSGTCLWRAASDERIQEGVLYRWRVQAVNLSGKASGTVQGSLPSDAVFSEWSGDDTLTGPGQRYFTIQPDTAATPTVPMTLKLSDFESQKVDAVSGQPSPVFTWDEYDFSSAPTTAVELGYELRVFDNANKTTRLATLRTPSTRIRATGVFADNTTGQPYFATVVPYFKLSSGAEPVYYAESASMFEWRKSSKALEWGTSPVTVRDDGTILLSWKPQQVTGGKDGGNRGYAITITKSDITQGTANTKLEYPFYVAQVPGSSTFKPLSSGTYKFSVSPLDANGLPGRSPLALQEFTVGVPVPTPSPATVLTSGNSARFAWTNDSSASKFKLEYKISTASAWTAVSDLKQRAATVADLARGTYSWRVSSVDASSNESGVSTLGTFTIGGGTVDLGSVTPAELPASERVLTWNAFAGASRYIVQIANNSSMTSPTSFETSATRFALTTSLASGTQFYWRVQPVAARAATPIVLAESAVKPFTILTIPGAPAIGTITTNGNRLTANWAALTGTAAGTTGTLSYLVRYRQSTPGDDWSGVPTYPTTGSALSYTTDVLSTGTTYQFQVAAVNTEGQGPWSATKTGTTATAPTAAPAGLRSTVAPGQLVISWSAVSGPTGAATTGYTVRYRKTSDSQFSTDSVTGTSATLSGLDAATSYYVEVAAVNSIGEGPSATLTATTVGAPTETPSGLAATTGPGTLALTWTAVAGPTGAKVTGYTIRYRAAGTGGWTSLTSTTTKVTLSALSAATSYEIEVAANNAVGEGPAASLTTSTVGGPVGSPAGATVTTTMSTAVLKWTAVAGPTGAPTTGYVVRYRLAGSGGWVTTTTTGVSTTVANLAPGTSYDFEIAALNAVAEGPATALMATTLALPSAPVGLSAAKGKASATLSWGAPASNGGSAITGYSLEQSTYNAKTKTWGAWAASSTTATTVAKTGLVNGTAYQFRVSAKTALGASGYSNVVTVTPAGPPTGPTKFTVTPKKGKFVLKWSGAAANGSKITGYIVQYSTNGKKWKTLKTTKGTAKTYTTKKGTKGKSYSFRVQPKNVTGKGTYSTVVKAPKK